MQNVVTLKQPIALLLNDGELHAAKILIGPNLSDSGDGIVLLVASFSAGIDNTVIPLNHTSAVGTSKDNVVGIQRMPENSDPEAEPSSIT
jgi:hypothetical protein